MISTRARSLKLKNITHHGIAIECLAVSMLLDIVLATVFAAIKVSSVEKLCSTVLRTVRKKKL